jgi:rubredoxin
VADGTVTWQQNSPIYSNSPVAVIYKGNKEPGDGQQADIAAARQKQYGYYDQLFNEAEREWSKPDGRGKMNVGEQHRRVVAFLLHHKLKAAPPPWYSARIDEVAETNTCPVCTASSPQQSILCRTCGYWFDPFKAFQLGEIDETHKALRRLSPAQLAGLGLKDKVESLETSLPAGKKPAPKS